MPSNAGMQQSLKEACSAGEERRGPPAEVLEMLPGGTSSCPGASPVLRPGLVPSRKPSLCDLSFQRINKVGKEILFPGLEKKSLSHHGKQVL